VVIISLNLLPERKDNFTSNAYELRMDCESAAEELLVETFHVKFKTTKGKFFLG
jgi:hypothetical protein